MAILALSGPAQAASPRGGLAAVTPGPASTPAGDALGGGTPSAPIRAPVGPLAPASTARLWHGVAHAPASAPLAVKRAIWAGNRLRRMPYRYGGGHRSFKDVAYDCSGSVSYVLHAAWLLDYPLDSTGFFRWGRGGPGRWITVYTNRGHAFVVVAGLRFDTSSAGDLTPQTGSGPRWRALLRSSRGFRVRHPVGL